MTSARYQYEGTEYLRLGEGSLTNYNASIAAMVCRYGAGARDVMDFGAGIGTLSVKVRSLGLDPLCVEPDESQRADLVRRGFRTVASLADVPAQSLGYIYSSNVLEHIEDDVRTLVALREKLRPGGTLFLYVPAFQSLFSDLDVTVGHVRRYDAALLGAKLREAGFVIEELFYADVFGYFATLLFKRLGNRMSNANSFTLQVFDRCIFPVGSLIERLVRVPVGKNVVGVARRA
jgi:SAM-dependent methyltransferase